MHRSSTSVAALATALAKAQVELVNPEKSLVATIRMAGRGETERTFRYAALSSGLDIVRKTLGRHEIAVVQTTATDPATSTIHLTTMLAHTSGEWIASDWPVCHLGDIATPRRMGAALTYARRYSLFTLVGIAGEDDLDAPDLNDAAEITMGQRLGAIPAAVETLQPIADPGAERHQRWLRHNGKPNTNRNILKTDDSAALREQLLTEIAGFESIDDLSGSAQRILKAKNSLTSQDAKLVEEAFHARALILEKADEDQPSLSALPAADTQPPATKDAETSPSQDATPADVVSNRTGKKVLTLAKPRRYRNKAHLKFVASLDCLLCGRRPSDAHHLRFAQPRALGRKVSDEFTVPLCRTHHHELHRSSDEKLWWDGAGIEPCKIASELWNRTRLTEAPKLSDQPNAQPLQVSVGR